MYKKEEQEKFIELRGKGKSLEEISSKLGVHKRTLNNWNKKFEDAIMKAEDVELEELTEKLKLNKAQRLRSFAKTIEKIDNELSSRNLIEISSQSLIALKIKTLEAIGKTLDSSKIEFGGEVIIKEDPLVKIWKACIVQDIQEFTTEEIKVEIERRSIIARTETEYTRDDD